MEAEERQANVHAELEEATPHPEPVPHAEDGIAGPRMGPLARGLALGGGALLLGIAALVTTSVALRTVTGAGITGDFEIVQLAAAIAAFCMFPLCVAVRGNIAVDTFTTRLPQRAQDALDGLWDVVFGLVAAILAWRLALGAADQFRSRVTLMMLPVPTWWAVAACAALMALLALTALVVGFRTWRKGA
ncbi:TRAP transporter small permease [Rubellimicrobium aerolatum]|uniref:TRAP transporter small permease protein n=1 Tax=Rubellimicrobium aerolatum TaxID=490979 RepID=A0ABW0SCD3_9RHOB|nr:TRAP transporter small permease [Rubellimicrobium aerolatum]MBP1806340.1 TRAP-type C4-dicarboxylate transport system permease small subunit [Rubellimicrobium aerolatum]